MNKNDSLTIRGKAIINLIPFKRFAHIFINNLLTVDEKFNRPLLFCWQPASLCESLNQPQLQLIDYNVYVNQYNFAKRMRWSPDWNENCQVNIESLENFHQLYPDFLTNSSYYKYYNGSLFKESQLGNYQLLSSFTGSNSGMQLLTEINKLLNQYKRNNRYVGAYSPVQ